MLRGQCGDFEVFSQNTTLMLYTSVIRSYGGVNGYLLKYLDSRLHDSATSEAMDCMRESTYFGSGFLTHKCVDMFS